MVLLDSPFCFLRVPPEMPVKNRLNSAALLTARIYSVPCNLSKSSGGSRILLPLRVKIPKSDNR